MPTDAELFEEAIACGLVTHIRLAAACHPDKIKLEEVCSPANAALLVFARKVLDRWGDASDEASEILDYYSRLAAQHAGKAVFHDPKA